MMLYKSMLIRHSSTRKACIYSPSFTKQAYKCYSWYASKFNLCILNLSSRKSVSTVVNGVTISSASLTSLCYDPINDYQSSSYKGNETKRKRILVCGDGDLSFGASLALGLKNDEDIMRTSEDENDAKDMNDTESERKSDVQLIVSVLESEMDHTRVYQNSKQNIKTIQECNQEVMFGVDATKLQNYFNQDELKFDRIQFNFPHWKGKQNNRRNRQLIDNFFKSATNFILPGGQIHMALLNHQGGMDATNKIEWKRSWMVGRYAGDSDLLLTHILPFEPTYNLSSYQWRDRPFLLNGRSQMYIFTKSDNTTTACKDIQLCSYFTLFMSIPSTEHTTSTTSTSRNTLWSKDQILDSDFIQNIIHKQILEGLDTEVDCWRIHFSIDSDTRTCILLAAEYRVCLFGERTPITTINAAHCKSLIEAEVQRKTLGTRNGGWHPSNVIPIILV